MKFSKIIGKTNDKMVAQAEEKLSQVFLELGTAYDNGHIGSGMGGDPLIFGLMYPVEHICTMNIPTAATDGKRYYWNPKFVIKQSRIGLRIICGHEAWHALYMHPQRRGSRLPKLWNIAVDYIVNSTVMDDFKARKMNAAEMFVKHLGKFMTLPQYAELLKDPFANHKGFDDLDPTAGAHESSISLPGPNEDRELTAEEQKELEKREKPVRFYYADPDLTEEMRSPEKIYDFLYSLLPKCPKCGSVGVYKPPSKNKGGAGKNKSEDKEKSQGKGKEQDKHNHEHGDGESCDCGEPHDGQGQDQDGKGCCDQCGGGVDIFGLGGTVDDHMDTEETQEKLAKRVSDAMEAARKMAGYVPAALEDELGKLTAPRVTWRDIVRTKLLKVRAGNGRNDWTRFRSRPMFSGVMTPKRRNYFAHFGCLLDTSGSMSRDDMALGISQLQGLDDRGECVLTCGDAEIYWDTSAKIKRCNAEELRKIVPKGRGGTMYASYFSDYRKHIGECDFLIVISDLYLLDQDVAEMKDPGVDVFWLCTSNNTSFKAPFGRVLHLDK